MGMYKYVRNLWKKPTKNLGDLWYSRLVEWRREPSTVRLEHPTRIDRARELGYKAKQGFIIVRQRVTRGGHTRSKPAGGRKPSRYGRRMNLMQSYRWICEQRAARKFPNCEVLNSYWVAQDGEYYWYEIILIDKAHPAILKDKDYRWTAFPENRRRVFRGLTSAGKKSRGLRTKGKGSEKARPSKNKGFNRKRSKIGHNA